MKRFPNDGPSLSEQQAMTYYWMKPQEAARLNRIWVREKREGRRGR